MKYEFYNLILQTWYDVISKIGGLAVLILSLVGCLTFYNENKLQAKIIRNLVHVHDLPETFSKKKLDFKFAFSDFLCSQRSTSEQQLLQSAKLKADFQMDYF